MSCMKSHCLSFLFLLATVVGADTTLRAQTFTVIHSFSGSDGSHPIAGVILDASGNVYGTTRDGGLGNGTVFRLTQQSGGSWSETLLYQFGSAKNDGLNPTGALIFDKSGNLYGTTQNGGAYGLGTIFRLVPSAGMWKETILHNFGNGTDGANPVNGLTYDGAYTVYGTTYYGGANRSCTYLGVSTSCGTAFSLSEQANGKIAYNIIHNFGSSAGDGFFPWSTLSLDGKGNLYGECVSGSKYLKGLLYELSPGTGGAWNETFVHPWGNKDDGTYIYGGVTFSSGNMYGVSSGGGAHGGLGSVFEFTPNGNGWAEHNLHGFGTGLDGQFPEGNLLVDASEDLFGVTHNGGSYGYGMVYEISLESGNWVETVLHNFSGGADGGVSTANLVADGSGKIYGTATYGGNSQSCGSGPLAGCGIVFTISQ